MTSSVLKEGMHEKYKVSLDRSQQSTKDFRNFKKNRTFTSFQMRKLHQAEIQPEPPAGKCQEMRSFYLSTKLTRHNVPAYEGASQRAIQSYMKLIIKSYSNGFL